ncbi:MAG: CinA family nicotinamide mononucleotide deamidase-related protein, partial [Pseudomonadales bacterium]|nr:CinA family nicotinamide mononucleotide deamidase-related protein [Pseudomonadales bacterium]
LESELARLAALYPAVIVNGGLGPTRDDLTAEVFSRLSGVELTENPAALAHLQQWCERRRFELNESNRKQAWLPAGATVLDNPVGSAVGFYLEYQGSLLLATPGVPGELTAMLDGDVAAVMQARFPLAESRFVRRIKLFGVGESTLQQRFDDNQASWPSEVELGFRAGAPLLEVKLEVSQASQLDAQSAAEALLRDWFGDFIVGDDDASLAGVVVQALGEQKKKLALAESCTGGGIAAQVTAISGASAVFECGVVSYANRIKHDLLGVDAALLEKHGAVSEEVALAMARGVLACSAADYAIAVTGIAGPEGGSEDKPVGTVWIAWGSAAHLHAAHFCYASTRKMFQTMVPAIALDLLRRHLAGKDAVPDYYRLRRR